MTLYEMTQQAVALYELLQNDEIDEQTLNDTLEAIGADEKLETYCKIIRQYEADAEAFKAEKDRMAQKQKSAENNATRMKEAVKEFMDAAGQTKAVAGLFKVALSESVAVELTDEAKIPEQFKIPQPVKIDKAGIRAALKAGEKVEGAELITNRSVRIK